MSLDETSIDGKQIVALWVATASILALTRLLSRIDAILAHPAAWQAAAGPLLVALVGLLAAKRLLRATASIRPAVGVLGLQLLAVSLGPLAYRLDVGPFVRLGVSESGRFADAGSDARLLFIIGSVNRIPFGIAINVLALAALVLLITSHRASISDPVANER